MAERRDSNSQLLQELESLSQSLYPSHPNRRTASLAIPRDAIPAVVDAPEDTTPQRPRSRRISMSPWRSRPKQQHHDSDAAATPAADSTRRSHAPPRSQQLPAATSAASGEKKGIWNWKPMRALSHIGMHRLGCLFSVEVAAVQGLPASMNGLRLSVAVRKKETKDGAVQTMPSRVLQGAADFEETLFIRCHVYCSGGAGTGKPLNLEPRPFVVSVIAIDAPELDLGRSTVDLSTLVKESMERSHEGSRVRQWDATFELSGKAKGGELVLKLGFQIMEDGGVGIYNLAEGLTSTSNKGKDSSSASSSFARRQSKSSFSVTSPRISRSQPSTAPLKEASHMDLKGIDDFSLDEPGPPPASPPPPPPIEKYEPETKVEDLDLLEFEVVDKGVEIQTEGRGGREEGEESEEAPTEGSVSSEVVKEVVQDGAHLIRLAELDEIAKQIKALESMIGDGADTTAKVAQEDENQRLDAEEEMVTREFLQMLELEDEKDFGFDMPDFGSSMQSGQEQGGGNGDGGIAFVSDLGKSLGSVVQTRDGGYLAAMNPFDVEVARKETPKLAMQVSKPLILTGDQKLASGVELFQKLAMVGSEELGSKLLALTSMDELMGKTAEQVAFEGMASAIISGRNKEGASSTAAKSVAILKTMATVMTEGRKERISTGIWNVKEEPVVVEEILTFSMQKMEAMAVEALKIQAEVADEEAPFDVSPLTRKEAPSHPLDSAISLEEWMRTSKEKAHSVTLLVVIQLRDPLRRYEAVGAPAIAVVQAARVDGGGGYDGGKYKVASLHVGGLKLRSLGGRSSSWDGDRQRLTAMQWLVAYGLVKAGMKSKPVLLQQQPLPAMKCGQDLVWSISSRAMADMWLKPMRNPDVKLDDPLKQK